MVIQPRTIQFLEEDCSHIWALLNQQAKRSAPKGFEEFLSGRWAAEGRSHLRIADGRVANLIAKTSGKLVGDTYRRDLSNVDSANRLAELLCEISLIDALGGISSAPPVLRPKTGVGTSCDVKVIIEGHTLYGESKRLADPWEGGARSIAKSAPNSKQRKTFRPRAMDLFSKLKDASKQLPSATLNVLFLFHPSVWNTSLYVKQALFGDGSTFDESEQPSPHGDGLYSLAGWREISACAHARVNVDGRLEIVKLWKNPNANVLLTDSISEKLAEAS